MLVSEAAGTVWLPPTESHSAAISMQMQCRLDQGLQNKCISSTVLFAATATNFGANPIKDRMLLT